MTITLRSPDAVSEPPPIQDDIRALAREEVGAARAALGDLMCCWSTRRSPANFCRAQLCTAWQCVEKSGYNEGMRYQDKITLEPGKRGGKTCVECALPSTTPSPSWPLA